MTTMQPGYEFVDGEPRPRTDYEARKLRGETPFAVIAMPEAFSTFWTGTGVAQGQAYSDDADLEMGARELKAAYEDAVWRPVGKGRNKLLTLYTRAAVQVLYEYAATCLNSNLGGDKEYVEMDAARKVMRRCQDAVGGGLTW